MEEDFLTFSRSRKVLKPSMWYVSRCGMVASVVIVCNERSPSAGIISNSIKKKILLTNAVKTTHLVLACLFLLKN